MEKKRLYISENLQYRGFKLYPNNRLPHFRVLNKVRIIEYNTRWWYSLTPSQELFCLEWCRKFYRFKNIFKADEKTKNWYISKELPFDEIYTMYRTMNHGNRRIKEKRLYFLLTEEVKNEHKGFLVSIRKFFKYIIQWIKSLKNQK